ncbi:MAG: CRISPR-associated protein Csx11 [Candidatus Nitrosocaldaceae archaeon]|nr:MAG: CRISPR-associated protein Csx11 [Candidatus Nitrosocaldaceae archaeon]
MSNIELERLSYARDGIILSEIGAYLHLLGRFSKEFILSNAEDYNKHKDGSYDYKAICNKYRTTFFERYLRLECIISSNRWEDIFSKFDKVLNEKITLKDFIEKHTWKKNGDEPKEYLLRLLADAHGIVSSIDKGLAGRSDNIGKQRKDFTNKSTVFGYETEIYLDYLQNKKLELLVKLEDVLTNILNYDLKYNIYEDARSIIKEYYQLTIGETRRPINEITLYDYAYTIASYLKSYIANVILENCYQNPKGKAKLRILSFNVDVLGLLSRGIKIGDILGYKREIEKVFNRIKEVIEFEYPLGNEIYRDNTGIYFTFPSLNNYSSEDIKNAIYKKIMNICKDLDFDICINISEPQRGLTIISKLRETANKEIVYHHSNIKLLHNKQLELGSVLNDVCPICRIRFKDNKERCKRCEERHVGRGIEWLKDPRKSIWLDEVADKNDRCAMIIGKFGRLDKWLNGKLVDTFVAMPFKEWYNNLSSPNKNFLYRNRKVKNQNDFILYLENLFNKNIKKIDCKDIDILKTLYYIDVDDKINKSNFDIEEHIWNDIIEKDASDPTIISKPNHLFKLLFRKHPTPARLMRIWRTTEEFITNTIFGICNKTDYNYGSNIRDKRLVFNLELDDNINKVHGKAYEVRFGNKAFNIVYDGNKNRFVTITNLQLISLKDNLEDIKEELKEQKIILVDNNKEHNAKITNCYEEETFKCYIPWIDIYNTPDLFMIIVPAENSLDILHKIIHEHKVQFSKVIDRLPLHLGVIFFHRKTPLYSIMDAANKMLYNFEGYDKEEYNYIVENVCNATELDCIDDRLGDKVRKVILRSYNNEDEKLELYVSYSTADPIKEDLWYPYIRVSSDVSDRELRIDEPKCVHVKELRKGDIAIVNRSLFYYKFLASSADRFDIINSKHMFVDDLEKIIEVWYTLKELKNRGLTDTALHNAKDLLLHINENLGDNKEYMIESLLINEFNLNRYDREFVILKHAMKDRIFLNSIEIYTLILKKKVSDDE